ncbi:Glycerophosphoryl diester phosphodiesterase family protein [Microbulbifer donghaiensis]|uniref:Glycerophosphoryl diester phosphodiesterase family protein n=2 Tax=Microbulbifer donghaiensis TaxID=494016 RepID=A0A1M5CM20_9GAMM|nr:Glycerophosphoryl diester phosphodiesterase family protein [Microbulbifer donghaiensis]
MLIAHRGDKSRHPENTIAAFEAAHSLGACAIKCDIRISADGTPWCYHRDTLHVPGSGKVRPFHELRDRELRRLPLNTFTQLVDWASCHRHLDWYIELAESSLISMGPDIAVETVVDLMRRECESFALLTRDHRSLRMARSLGCHRVALQVNSVVQCLSASVVTLAPDYLLIRDSEVEIDELPPGPWQWVVYEINSAADAVRWRARGAHHILTGDLPLLMRSREASDVYGF